MCHTSEYDHYFNEVETDERATPILYNTGSLRTANYHLIRMTMKNEFENLARRQSCKYIDHTDTAEINTYAVYMRDREGWVYCWLVEIDEKDELKNAQEILVFDSENAPDSIPACVAEETARLDKWKAIIALDPKHDESYYNPA